MIDIKDRIGFLNRIHVFAQLKDEELAGIAAALVEGKYAPGEVVFQRGMEPDGFYMIYRGRVQVTRPRKGGREHDLLAWLVQGDYFGEEALFANRPRSADIHAVDESILLFLSRDNFESLLKKYPQLKPNFQVAIKSRQLARLLRFKWLGPREVIYFIARRHNIRLIQSLIAPVLLLSLPIFLGVWSVLTVAVTPAVLAILSFIGILLWGVWNIIDWSNDYYIVTNQRVIWLEKIIGIYDSRQEAPLSSVLSVGVSTDPIGRALNYGTVTVRTFVGKITFDYINHPNEAAGLIREHWERTKTGVIRAEKEAMKNAIRSKLGMPVRKRVEDEDAPAEIVVTSPQKVSALRIVLSNLFKLRVEESGSVTYHKHWFVLLQQTAKPLAFILAIFGLMISRGISLFQSPAQALINFKPEGGWSVDTMIVALPIVMIPFVGWLIWEYVDWSNDIYQVTPDEILDIDKKPLGTQERRAAQLDNILSTEYKRVGLTGYLLNFGTVYITVGGTQLAFEDVMDPAGVQADIDRRRMARLAKKREDSASQDRERMATWLAAYHQNLDEFNAEPPPPIPFKENGNEGEKKSG